MLALQGSLDFLTCECLFLLLHEKNASGHLIIRSKGSEKRLTILQGAVVSATSNDPRDYLGQILLRKGVLTEEGLLEALQAHQKSGLPLGQILVMTGAASREVVRDALVSQTKESALGLFEWLQASFSFRSHRVEPDGELGISVSLADLAEEGKKRTKPPVEVLEPERSTTDWFPITYHSSVEKSTSATDPFTLAREALATGDSQAALEILDGVAPYGHSPEWVGLRRAAEDRLLIHLRAELLKEGVKPRFLLGADAVRDMPLSPPERYLLRKMDGSLSLETLLKICPLRQIDALRLVRRLRDDGQIRY